MTPLAFVSVGADRGGRRGGVLVCVLVVLLLVGLISAQSLQTLLVLRRSDGRRADLAQVREVLTLGQMLARQEFAAASSESNDGATPAEWIIDVNSQERAKITAEYRIEASSPSVWIEVYYPLGSEAEMRASSSLDLAPLDAQASLSTNASPPNPE